MTLSAKLFLLPFALVPMLRLSLVPALLVEVVYLLICFVAEPVLRELDR